MSVYIQNIATLVPEFSVKQSSIRDKMKQYMGGDPLSRRIIHRIYSKSGIETRHAVIEDFQSNGREELFFKDDGSLGDPTTQVRNDIYTKHAKSLFTGVAKKLLLANSSVKKENVTHVITVSCTGFFTPDPPYFIIKELGLSDSTQRFHIGFMGCFAAFPAFNLAHSICKADCDANVMIVSTELCSLHFQDSNETDQLVAASVFADGAAGALVSAAKPKQTPAFRLENFHTSLVDHSEDDMAWIIGNTGFEMVLSRSIPDIIEENLEPSVTPLLEDYNRNFADIDHWAVHPGGRAILDRVEGQLQLQPEQIAPSRHVLSQYGNMSSATILFVLEELLNSPSQAADERTLAMAFGPGLTIESALLTKLN